MSIIKCIQQSTVKNLEIQDREQPPAPLFMLRMSHEEPCGSQPEALMISIWMDERKALCGKNLLFLEIYFVNIAHISIQY